MDDYPFSKPIHYVTLESSPYEEYNVQYLQEQLRITHKHKVELNEQLIQARGEEILLLNELQNYNILLKLIHKRFPESSVTRSIIDMFLGKDKSVNIFIDRLEIAVTKISDDIKNSSQWDKT